VHEQSGVCLFYFARQFGSDLLVESDVRIKSAVFVLVVVRLLRKQL